MASAPRDGTPIRVRRLHKGRIIYAGPAAWRTVRFPPLFDPITHECYALEHNATGWMRVDQEHRVPEPTHWMPA